MSLLQFISDSHNCAIKELDLTVSISTYLTNSKTCVKRPLKERRNKGLNENW